MNVKHLLIVIAILGTVGCTGNSQTSTPLPIATATPSPIPTPTFAFEKYGTAELDVTYCTPNDIPQKMDIYYPTSSGPWPVLLYVHGGGWSEGDKAEGAGWRILTQHGFLVVSVNYRLASSENKFPSMIEDVKCAVRYLRAHASQYNLDVDHIGAVGASVGGHLVALLGLADKSTGWDTGEYADQSSRVQAVITLAGLSDFTRGDYGSIPMAIYYAFGEMPGSPSEKLVAASPVTYISPDDPPFLIIHGDKDGIVPVEQSHVLDEQLKDAGVPSELVIVRNGTHSIDGENISPTEAEIANLITAFLEKYLKE